VELYVKLGEACSEESEWDSEVRVCACVCVRACVSARVCMCGKG